MQNNLTKKSRSKGKITLNDVANALNISAITVSRAINTPEKVSIKVRKSVEKMINQLGYIPNRAARQLASNRTNIIAVVIPSISNTVYSQVINGIYDTFKPHNFDVIIANTYYSQSLEDELIYKLLAQQPDGIILSGLDTSTKSKSILKKAGIPIVQIMESSHTVPIDMNVGVSHFDAGKMMAEYFLQKKYQNIGFIGAQMDPRSLRRKDGFFRTLEDNNHTDHFSITTQAPSSVKVGGQLAADMLTQYPKLDAVFCNNDDIAYGALYECQRRNISVPEQLAVAGFNDLDSSEFINPSLTTIKVPLHQMGMTAAELLIDRINGKENTKQAINLNIELKIRDSA